MFSLIKLRRFSTDWWFSQSKRKERFIVVARLVDLDRLGKIKKVYDTSTLEDSIQKVAKWIPARGVTKREILNYINKPMEGWDKE